MSKRDYYEVLGVDKTADDKTLKSAFRKKAMGCHPDRHPDDPEAEAKFKEVNEAYGILSDADKRSAYDRMGHRAFEQGGMGGGGQGGFQDFGDIFSQIFGGGAAGGRPGRVQMPETIGPRPVLWSRQSIRGGIQSTALGGALGTVVRGRNWCAA